MTLAQNQKLTFISPPSLGLNGRDPWFGMDSRYSIEMLNVEPKYNFSKCRKGFALLGTSGVSGSSEGPLGVLVSSSRTFTFAFGSGSRLFTITSAGVWTDRGNILSSPPTMVPFGGVLHITAGTAGIMSWNGAALTNPVAWTGTGFTATDIRRAWSHKGRMYFLDEANNVWFGDIDATSGALTKLPLQKYLTKGGVFVGGGTTNSDSSEERDSLMVVVSSEGEVVIFRGQDPSASDWSLINTYQIGKPASNHAWFNYGQDFHIVTTLGVVAVSDILAGRKDGSNYVSLSTNIDPLLTSYYANTLASSLTYVQARMAISNSENLLYSGPTILNTLSGTTVYGYFVMNLSTKAWSFYVIPDGSNTYFPISNHISAGDGTYFILSTISGGIPSLWKTNSSTLYDAGSSNLDINWYSISAFTNDKANYNKKLNKIRPITKNMLALTLGSYADFDTTFNSNTIATSLAMNKKFYDINQEANFFAVRVGGSSADSGAISLPEYYGSYLSYEPGSNVP